jgi:hypothetical protein
MRKIDFVRQKLLDFVYLDSYPVEVKMALTQKEEKKRIIKEKSITMAQNLNINDKDNFSKYIQEIDNNYIDSRKQNVGTKKMKTFKPDFNSIRNPIYLQFSNYKEVIHDKYEIKELFMNKEENEAILIQDNYNILHKLVESFKRNIKEMEMKYEFETGDHTKINKALFDILNFRGIINPKHFQRLKKGKIKFENVSKEFKIEVYEKEKLEFLNNLFDPKENDFNKCNIERRLINRDNLNNQNSENVLINLITCSDRTDMNNLLNLNLSSSDKMSISVSDYSSYSEVSDSFDVEDSYS